MLQRLVRLPETKDVPQQRPLWTSIKGGRGRNSRRSLTSDYVENLMTYKKLYWSSNLECSSNFDSYCTPIIIRQVSLEKRSETQVGVGVKCALLLTICNENLNMQAHSNMQASNFNKIYLVVSEHCMRTNWHSKTNRRIL